MKPGKISEIVLKRSILRQIKNRKEEVTKGAGIGNDCAFFSWESTCSRESKPCTAVASCVQTVTLPVKNAAYLAVMSAANNLAAAGASPISITLSITLPEEADEILLKELMEQAENCCQELSLQIAGGHTEVSSAIHAPVISAFALGKVLPVKEIIDKPENLDIVVSKWIGLEGTAIIAKEKERELSQRYPARLLYNAKALEQHLSILPEAAIALKSSVYAMHDARNGGIFGALWELSQKIGVGLCTDLKKIPVKQETIEICEYYHLNPYKLLSGGMLIILTNNGNRLVTALTAEGIPAAVIGNTNMSNDKIIINADETRYLEPPMPDEIFKISFH